MKIALVQISDIHLTENLVDNPVLGRAALIAAAVNSICQEVQYGILIVSGDTAYSGIEAEYRQGKVLIESIRSGIAPSFPGKPVRVLTIAGNHDCNFALADSVRGIVLDSLKPDRIDDAVIAQCAGVQRYYSTFAGEFDPHPQGTVIGGVDIIYRQAVVEQGEKKLVFHLLNSAWVSQLHEKVRGLYFPVHLIKDRIAEAPPADLAVAVIHHPFNWYSPENARELKQCLENSADLILTGHEHVSGAYGKRADTGEQNEYLEGGVLQESGHPETSSFNVIIFDIDQKQQQTHRFVWNGNLYAVEGEPYWRPFERNKRLTRNQFQFADAFAEMLEDPGAGYTHPHKDPLHLSDLFVYPDMQEMQYQREGPDRPLVRSQEVATYVLNNTRVLIVAEDKGGKTSTAKSLVKDLHRNGKIPVLLDGEMVGKCLDGDRLRKAVNSQLDHQYGTGRVDSFWQLLEDRQVVVVDDFHKSEGNRKSKDQLVKLLCEHFGCVVLLAADGFRFEDISAPAKERSPLWEFKQLAVMEFGHVLRHTLVSKWCRLGHEYSDEEADIQRQIKRTEDQISVVIRVDILPSFPVYILILLQQLESAQKVTTNSGSFGYLYEVLVTASLSRRKAVRVDLETKYNYLTEFAYHLFDKKKRSLPEEELRKWHTTYCSDYKLTLDFGVLWDELVETGVIDLRYGEYRFRYKYLYYFFVGRYFRDHIGKREIQEGIRNLSRRLYHEESANIMIFLCHLSKDQSVLEAMLEAARNLFPDTSRFNVGAQAAFLNRVTQELPKLVLKDGDTADNRRALQEARDESERQQAAGTPAEPSPEQVEPDEEITSLLMHNAAAKTIQILGQVLRNFTGSLKGEPKRQLVEACYGLGLRALGHIFDMAEKALPELLQWLTEYAKSRPKPPAEGKVEQFVNRLLFGLLHAVSFGIFKHISNSVGTEKVAQTFEEVVAAADNPSVKVIDLSVRLDHYKLFPKAQIEELAAEFEDNVFAMSIVRYMVWHHLYLFPVDYQQKQHACQTVGISLEQQAKLLAPDAKKTTTKRNRGEHKHGDRKRKNKKNERQNKKNNRKK